MSGIYAQKNRQAEVLACLSLIAVLLITFVISGFSSADGESSGGLSEKISLAVIRVIFPGYGDFSPEKRESILETVHFIVRKCAHFLEFASLGFFSMMTVNRVGICFADNGRFLFFRRRTDTERKGFACVIRRGWIIPAVYCVLTASADEIHQAFVPGRGPSFRDVLIDSAGAFAGILLLLLCSKLFSGLRSGRQKC